MGADSGSGGMSIKIELDKKSKNRLTNAAKGMTGRQMKSKLSNETGIVAKLIRDYAKSVVPVQTGRLRASIQSRKTGALARNDVTWTVVATAHYAMDVEFGTGSRRAKPYLRPAYRMYQDSLNGRLGRAIKDQWRRVSL